MVEEFLQCVQICALIFLLMKKEKDGWKYVEMNEKNCQFIILDNGSPLGSSMFFSPSTQATTLTVELQNMEEPRGLHYPIQNW